MNDDRSQPSAAALRFSVGIWGMPRSGKTMYLTMLYLGLNPQSRWTIEPLNDQSSLLLLRAREVIKQQRQFLDHTDTPTDYAYALSGTVAGQPVNITLEFTDAPGELDRDFYEKRVGNAAQNQPVTVPRRAVAPQEAKLTAEERFAALCAMDGLLLFIDPAWHEPTRHERSYQQLLINLIGQLRRQRQGALPQLLALCLTKADAEDRFWERRDLSRHTCFREGGETSACRSACPVYDFLGAEARAQAGGGAKRSNFMESELIVELGVPNQANLKCFALSSVGRTEADTVNVAHGNPWVRPLAPVPPWGGELAGQNGLAGVDVMVAPQTDRPINPYYPTGIIDIDDINPANLLQPLEWMIAQWVANGQGTPPPAEHAGSGQGTPPPPPAEPAGSTWLGF